MEEEIAKTEYCSNCRRDIPAANYVMHVTHCQRNLTLCKVCGEPVPTSQQEEHFEENHVKVKCDCGEQVEKMNLEEHKEKDCPSRLVKCQYCELEIAFSELTSHVEYCGSRTEKCEMCDRYVQKKDIELHLETGCQYPVKEEKKSIPSRGPDNLFSEIPVGMLHAMGLMGSSETSSEMENFFPFAPGMREFGKILTTGLGTPPFNGANYFGDVDEDSAFDGRHDVIARGTGGMAKRRIDRHSTDSFEHVDVDYTWQSNDDDETFAAVYQADEFDSTNGPFPPSSTVVDEPFPNTPSSPVADFANDTTQLPCEFCGKLFPLDSLILHQSGCQLRSFDSYASTGSADIFYDGTPMYDMPGPYNSTVPMREDIVGNHRELTSEDDEDDPDATFLPCEFCQELFPCENLIQHQSICDAGAPSLAPPLLYNGSAQPPLNNSRPEARRGSRSRPSRPVYEGKKIQKSMENFIPRELDDFGPDSLEVRRNENGLHRENGNYGFDEVTSAPMNNEIPRRVSSNRALERETLVRNTDNTGTRKQLQRKATGGNTVVGETPMGNSDLPHRLSRKETSRVNGVARKHQQRKTSGDNAVVGETAMGNSDLHYRPPREEASRAKSMAVDPLGKRSSELRNGFTSDTHQAPVAKKHQQRKRSGDNVVVGETAIGNSDLHYRPPREEASRAKSVAVDPFGKRSLESRNGYTTDTHQTPVVKPTESSMGQRKMNTRAARNPANEGARPTRVQRTRDSTNGTKPFQPRVDEATQRSIKDSSGKLPSQVNKSGTRSSKPWQDGVHIVSAAAVRSNASRSSKTTFQGSPKTVNPSSGSSAHMSPNPRRNPVEGVNIVSAAAVRSNVSRSSKTSFQGSPKTVNPSSGSSAHVSPNPRRNPPTFTVDGISVNSAQGKMQGTNSESQTRDTQSSTQPKKTTKKKVV